MNKETKEFLVFAKEYSQEIIQITKDYRDAIQSLANAEDFYKKQVKWQQFLLKFLQPLIYIVIVLMTLVIVLRYSTCPNPLSIKFFGLEITQQCNAIP